MKLKDLVILDESKKHKKRKKKPKNKVKVFGGILPGLYNFAYGGVNTNTYSDGEGSDGGGSE